MKMKFFLPFEENSKNKSENAHSPVVQKDTSIVNWDFSCILMDVAKRVQLFFVGHKSKAAVTLKLEVDEFLECSSLAQKQNLGIYNSDSILVSASSQGLSLQVRPLAH